MHSGFDRRADKVPVKQIFQVAEHEECSTRVTCEWRCIFHHLIIHQSDVDNCLGQEAGVFNITFGSPFLPARLSGMSARETDLTSTCCIMSATRMSFQASFPWATPSISSNKEQNPFKSVQGPHDRVLNGHCDTSPTTGKALQHHHHCHTRQQLCSHVFLFF